MGDAGDYWRDVKAHFRRSNELRDAGHGTCARCGGSAERIASDDPRSRTHDRFRCVRCGRKWWSFREQEGKDA